MSQLPTSKTLAKAIVFFGGAQGFTVLAALLRSKVASVTIGSAGVGLNAMYVTLFTFIANIVGCGLASSSIPTLSKMEGEQQREAIARLRLVGGMLTLATIPVTALAALYYGGEVLWLILPAMATVVSGIESAVLKSLQASRELVSALVLNAIISVLFTIPFFIYMGYEGVIYAVVCATVMAAVPICWHSFRLCNALPTREMWRDDLMEKLRPMFILGFSFLVTGLVSQGTELLIQTWFSTVASFAVLGLYKAGFQLSIGYTGMMFSAVSNDFYPRLSKLSDDATQRNILVSRQMRVQFLMAVPAILLFILLAPWIIKVLLSDEFLPIVPMVRIAALTTILKAIYLPIGFIPVSLGKSTHFLLLEVVSWGVMALGVMVGYRCGGLNGVGVGLLLANLFDLCFVWLFCRIKYSFRLCFDN